MAIDVHRFLDFLLGSWHNQCLIFRWITREVVGFIPATSCIRVLLTTADDVVNLLTRKIYLVVVSVSTQLRSNVFIKQIILIKNSTTLGQVMTPRDIHVWLLSMLMSLVTPCFSCSWNRTLEEPRSCYIDHKLGALNAAGQGISDQKLCSCE